MDSIGYSVAFVGGVEFIVRFCGGFQRPLSLSLYMAGGCKCQKSHIHYRLCGVRLDEERLKGGLFSSFFEAFAARLPYS